MQLTSHQCSDFTEEKCSNVIRYLGRKAKLQGVRLPLGKIKLHLLLEVPCPCCDLVVRVVGVAVVGMEVILPLQRVLGADPSLAAADGKVLQPELPVAA